MALQALLLRKKIDSKERELEALTQTDFEKREADLETAINEAAEKAEAAESEEEKAEAKEAQDLVESEVEKFEAEKREHDQKVEELRSGIEALNAELRSLETVNEEKPEVREEKAGEVQREEHVENMNTREFFGKSVQERDAIFMRDDVKEYLGEIRSCIREKRALTNVGLTIPSVFLGILRENIQNYSKLYKHVNVRRLGGEGRLIVMGSVPEAVWTDCCANLNELDLIFNDVEINCWKCGGFFAVCNAVLEDSDIDLASELIVALGQAIGYALDKAILYGTGTRMPLGVMTRLVQTEQPSDYQATARPWVDLHTSNVLSIAGNVKDVELFKQLTIDSGAAKGDYAMNDRVWVMNESTYTNLIANAMSVNAAGGIVTGVNGYMPVIGGVIEKLNFVPDNVIIGGYFDLYLVGERAGEKFATSEHYRFLNDQTVFKGTARYDGKPVIDEAFAAIGLNGVIPTADMTFAPDEANF